MTVFGWISAQAEPPERWDLRRVGWRLCARAGGAACRHVLLVDARGLPAGPRLAHAETDRPASRLLVLGIDEPAERARLLGRGCAEALPASTALHELEARARRVDEMSGMLPRWRRVGPLTLDLFHRDARRGPRWLGLHPREFALLWRLADQPGARVSRAQLLRDVWRIHHEPDTNSVEVHVSRLRSKLAGAGCAALVETSAEGGYRLSLPERFMLAGGLDGDRYLRPPMRWPVDELG